MPDDSLERPEPEARILVVDDDASARAVIVATLETNGFVATEAITGDQALRLLSSQPVDAVLLDRTMPDMDGVELLRWIRRTPAIATTPVVLVTGKDDVADLVEGLGVGADDYVVKPFDPDELVARLRSHLRGRTAWRAIVDREVDRRNALVDAARSASATTGVEQGALELCEGLARVPWVRGAGFVELTADTVTVLAVKGDDPMEPLRAEWGSNLAARLSARAHDGAWVSPPSTATGALAVAVAPVRADDTIVGLVLAAAEPDVSRADLDHLHATLIDFAALAGGVFGPELVDSAHRKSARRDFLRIADAREFTVVFQPVVDLVDETIVGYEALARFDSGISPLQVFGEATNVGAGHTLEIEALVAALEAAPVLDDDRWLSVNVSPSLILERQLAASLERAGTRQIVLELSELQPVADYLELRDAISALGKNVVLSVDDAGSGFASLAHILALGATFVKLDQSWVHDIAVDPAKRALVAGIQNFAAETGATVIAEGIETDAELETIRRLGIELGQGFLLGRPASH